RAVLLAREDDERHARRLIMNRRIVDWHLLARRLKRRDAAFGSRHQKVLDADVGEGAAHHHLMVAATRAVRVEVLLLDAAQEQVASGGRGRLDSPGGRDVVGRDGVAEDCERARAEYVAEAAGLHAEALEVGRLLYVG